MREIYANSKAANIFFSEALKEFSEIKDSEYSYSKILSSSLHPGAIYTDRFKTDGKAIWYLILINIFYRLLTLLLFKDE